MEKKISLRKNVRYHVWAGNHAWTAELNEASTDLAEASRVYREAARAWPHAQLVRRTWPVTTSCQLGCCGYRLRTLLKTAA